MNVPNLKRPLSPLPSFDITRIKKPRLENMNFVTDLIDQWNYAANNHIVCEHLIKLFRNTTNVTEKLKQIEESSSNEEKGNLCIAVLNKFNSLPNNALRAMGAWIGSSNSHIDDNTGAYYHFNKFIKIFKIIFRTPKVYKYVGKRQEIDLKYAQITEMAKLTLNSLPRALTNASSEQHFVMGISYEKEPAKEVEIFYPNGERYVGAVHDGLRHGKGIYTYGNGFQYEGVFVKGKLLLGEVKILYPNGDIYIGSVLKGLRHGIGVHIDSNGLGYKGKFLNGHLIERL